MSWAEGWWLWWLLGLPLLVTWGYFALQQRANDLRMLGISALGAQHKWRLVAVLGVLLTLVVALAQPRLQQQMRPQKIAEREIIFVLDLSRSMLADDVSPTRLDRAKREILDVVSRLEGDRFALVVFANLAYPVLPLTKDKQTFAQVLKSSNPEQFKSQGSNLASGILTALKGFDSEHSTTRVIVFVSDGEDIDDSLSTLDPALSLPPIYALGVGGDVKVPIRLTGGELLYDRGGQLVMSRRVDGTLLGLAKRSEGAFVVSVPGEEDTAAIEEGLLRATTRLRSEQVQLWEELFQWALTLGLLFIVFGFAPFALPLLSLRGIALGGLMVSMVRAEDWQLWTANEWQDDHQNLPELRAAAELAFSEGEHHRAALLFAHLLEHPLEIEEQVRVETNAGVSAAKTGQLERALGHWERAIAIDPRASEAGHNHRLVKAELERRKSVPDQVESSTEDPSNGKSAPSAADTLSESGVVDRNRAVQIIHSVREGRSRGSYGGGDDAEHPW